MSEWISVRDKIKPSDKESVLIWYVNGMHGSSGYGTATYYEDDDTFYRDASGSITHWQPLPEPPKEN
jgi:hypothetical protein